MTNIKSVKGMLVSLIESIDMYNFLLKDHHRRVSAIAYQLGNFIELEADQLSNLILAASVHDIGALHVHERDMLLHVDVESPQAHEILGAKMLEGFEPFKYISKIVRHHHVRFDDVASGNIAAGDVPYECYLLHLADRIEVLLAAYKNSDECGNLVVKEINQRFGTVFLPELSDVFNNLAEHQEFWDNIDDESFHKLLFSSVETAYSQINNNDLEALAELFARVVDYKSPWTSYHSKSVSRIANRIGELMGLSKETCFELKIAGYLHDIGKIALPSEILDKPEPLDEEEYRLIKSHATYSSLILSKIDGIDNILKWAVNHHEKRNKTGYPLHIGEKQFTVEMDIIAFADIFVALAEDRPYRDALGVNQILNILKEFVPNQLDASVYKVIEANSEDLHNLHHSLSCEFNWSLNEPAGYYS